MRYREGHKAETRRRIVEVAARRFRKEGADAVGVAGLMADAGLTHGGFYAHFKSKEALLGEAVAAALAGTTEGFERLAQSAPDGLAAIVRAYLSRTHRDEPQQGCAGASLAAEIARASKRTRRAFADSVAALVAVIEAQLPSGDPVRRRSRATAIFALLMGALQLARAEPDAERAQQILESGIEAALALGR
jgi:TetR/AcrR family transcriptional regulator, transcriptional repressor for nem operon